jgi:hypothetical protein
MGISLFTCGILYYGLAYNNRYRVVVLFGGTRKGRGQLVLGKQRCSVGRGRCVLLSE